MRSSNDYAVTFDRALSTDHDGGAIVELYRFVFHPYCDRVVEELDCALYGPRAVDPLSGLSDEEYTQAITPV